MRSIPSQTARYARPCTSLYHCIDGELFHIALTSITQISCLDLKRSNNAAVLFDVFVVMAFVGPATINPVRNSP